MQKIIATAILSLMVTLSTHAQKSATSTEYTFDQANNIRKYLCETAGDITRSALSDIDNLSDWTNMRKKRHAELIEMLGMQDHWDSQERTTPKITRTGTIKDNGFRIEKLYYESLPDLFVAANLYVPDDIIQPVPAILYVCGHAHTQKHHYQSHARAFAQRGFVCLIIETIQRGEVKGEHLGAESRGWFHWYSRGYNPAGVEVWNGIRGIDILVSLPEVDPDKIGVTGISGGGSQSWYLAAVDERIKAAAAVAGAASLEGQICQRTIDDHCDCMMPINTYGIDFSDIGALVAPRSFLIAQTTGDGYYSIEAVRTLFDKISPIYDLYDQPESLKMIEAPGGHSYGAKDEFRAHILAFFSSELMEKKIDRNESNAIDMTAPWTEEELSVYVDGVPINDKTKTIQDAFLSVASPPLVQSREQLDEYRDKVVGFLHEKTFNAIPKSDTPIDLRSEFQATDFGKHGTQHYSFISEIGWRLKFSIRRRQDPTKKSPLLLVLRNPGEERWASNELASGADTSMHIAYFAARGIGETGWDPALQWHIRRAAAWTGRTIASMRVHDVLRCLTALRETPGVDPANIYLAAQGEMAAIASYAAVLDRQVKGLVLKHPPASQNMASEPSGKGPAIEMLNCLQITDLAQVTA
ncbi:MAG: hypothetical protein HKN76_19905, partial [Saprospiraceae bacterium]|nr:hypothetical protein [Saprospiraceae bacterium]